MSAVALFLCLLVHAYLYTLTITHVMLLHYRIYFHILVNTILAQFCILHNLLNHSVYKISFRQMFGWWCSSGLLLFTENISL